MKSRRQIELGLALWILALGIPDYVIGLEAPVSLFYAVATLLAGYYGRMEGAVGLSLWAFLVHLISNHLSHFTWESRAVEDLFRLMLWLGTGVVGTRLRSNLDKLAMRTDQLEASQDQMKLHMERARFVQERLLENHLEEDPRLDLCWEFRVAIELGGDFLDLRRDGSTFSYVIADVSGKGPSAALVAAVLRGLVHETHAASPGEMLNRLNRSLAELLPDSMFATCFACSLDLETGLLRYANAGHEGPLLYRDRDSSLTTLLTSGMPLGIDAHSPIEELATHMQPGDLLLAYTDGLSESPDAQGGMLGAEAIEAELLRCSQRPAKEICARMMQLSPDFARHRYRDDVLVVVAGLTKPAVPTV